MPLRIDVPENFLNLFHKILENEPVENGNKLNLFSLKISNNVYGDIQKHISEQLNGSQTEPFIEHYRNTYNDPKIRLHGCALK